MIIGYAENLKVYHIEYNIDDYLYIRFNNGRLEKRKIHYQDETPYIKTRSGVIFFLNEITSVSY